MATENIIILIVGLFTLVVGITKIGFQTRKAQRLIRLTGEAGARIIYFVIGIALIVLAFVL